MLDKAYIRGYAVRAERGVDSALEQENMHGKRQRNVSPK